MELNQNPNPVVMAPGIRERKDAASIFMLEALERLSHREDGVAVELLIRLHTLLDEVYREGAHNASAFLTRFVEAQEHMAEDAVLDVKPGDGAADFDAFLTAWNSLSKERRVRWKDAAVESARAEALAAEGVALATERRRAWGAPAVEAALATERAASGESGDGV